MWKNFLRITLRNLNKNKAFNVINIAGVAMGVSTTIFLILYSKNETSYDRFHDNGGEIYRLYIEGQMAGQEFIGAWGNSNYGPTFYEEIPEIVNFCRFDFYSNQLMWEDPDTKYLENGIMLADSTFFDMFSIRLLEGDPSTCLSEPHTIVLSESKAAQYFP